MTDRQFDATHSPRLLGLGPRHYECADLDKKAAEES